MYGPGGASCFFPNELRSNGLKIFAWHFSVGSGVRAAIDQNTLAPDVSRVGKADGSAERALFLGLAVSACGIVDAPFLPELVKRFSCAVHHALNVAAMGIGGEYNGQKGDDGDVVAHRLPRQTGNETHQPGARAIGQAQLEPGRLEAARNDIDDTPEPAGDHWIDGSADHFYRAYHHRVERGMPVGGRPLAKIPRRRAVRVVDQN